MCRFTCGVLLVLAVFFAILGIWGFDVFFNVLVVGFLASSLGLVLMPRRGVQNAYRNRVVLSVGAAMVLVFATIMGGAYAGAELANRGVLSSDAADNAYNIASVAFILAVGLVPPLWAGYTPTRSRRWLRRKYPQVAAAIGRYRKSGEVREKYVPAVVLDGRRCFLVFYYEKKSPDQLRGAILLDENGRVLDDRALAECAVRMKHLARETIDYYRHQARARALSSGGRAIRGLKYVYRVLRDKKERFAALGPQVLADWERVMAVERTMLSVLEASYMAALLEAEWAKEHGLGRLTEVREEEFLEFEAKFLEIRRPYLVAGEVLAEVSEPARRLAEAARRMWDIPHPKEVAEGLLGVADVGQASVGYVRNEYRYAKLLDEDWQAWRERTAWAKELEAVRGELGMATP